MEKFFLKNRARGEKKFPTFKITHTENKFNFPLVAPILLLYSVFALCTCVVTMNNLDAWNENTTAQKKFGRILFHGSQTLFFFFSSFSLSIIRFWLFLLFFSSLPEKKLKLIAENKSFAVLWFFWIFIRMNWKEEKNENWCIKFNASWILRLTRFWLFINDNENILARFFQSFHEREKEIVFVFCVLLASKTKGERHSQSVTAIFFVCVCF